MQENYRTDFCLKGSVINIINIGKLGMTRKKLTSVPKEYIDKSKRVDGNHQQIKSFLYAFL